MSRKKSRQSRRSRTRKNIRGRSSQTRRTIEPLEAHQLLAADLMGGGSGIVGAELDFGDAPDSYRTLAASGGASHSVVTGTPMLGGVIDLEGDGQPHPNALGDDLNGLADEEGVTFLTPLTPGNNAQVEVKNGGATGLLNAWMDFNASGTFDPLEQIFTDVALPGGSTTLLNFPVPAAAVVGAQSFARFRINFNGGIGPSGFGFEGEVEDYEVAFQRGDDNFIDFGDAPDPYPTLMAMAGAGHMLRSDGPILGTSIDPEPDGQPSLFAIRDDVVGVDDEDGVIFTTPLVAGGVASVDVTNGGSDGLLNAWIDFDADGVWAATEQIATDIVIPAGATIPVGFAVPAGSATGVATYARFRIDSGGGLTPTGIVDDGEVEDYVLDIDEGNDERIDFGDAPDTPYPTLIASSGAGHFIVPDAPMLGATIDAEPDGQPSFGASRDDTVGIDDEDGVVFTTPLVAGLPASVDVTNGGTDGLLNAWIDFDGDGIWAAAEQIATDVFVPAGATIPVGFAVTTSPPTGAATYARFRIDSGGGLTPKGIVDDGEVEDYIVEIEPQQDDFIDFGDAPDAPYPTLMASGGAGHFIRPDAPMLGALIDAEPDGQPSFGASRDDAVGIDDEDGVAFPTMLSPGGFASVDVTNGGTDGLLNAWIDFDGDGIWAPGEQIATDVFVPAGATIPVGFFVPAVATPGTATYARFRIDSGGGLTPAGIVDDGEVEDYIVEIEQGQEEFLDFGDAPDGPYPTLLASGGAAHFIVPGGPMLGTLIDPELDGQPNPFATGDDLGGIDDEDGVVLTAPLSPGAIASFDVTNGGAAGLLNAWVDFNGDGIWAPAEQIATDLALPGGGALTTVFFVVPAGAIPGTITFARFRVDTGGGLGPAGLAPDGEVEDYQVRIIQGQQDELDWGDAPDPTYPTLAASGGASHVISPNGPMLGTLIDAEPDGQPTPFAGGDDLAGIDDEDGVLFTSSMYVGGSGSVDVTNGGAGGRLNAWIDFDADGVWTAAEQIATDLFIPGGATVPVSFTIPVGTAVGVPTYARFRINSAGGLAPGGMATDGEVEDYVTRFSYKPGDFDLDGDADGDDFLIWQQNFPNLTGTATVTDGDANGDGNVDGDDFLLWQSCFGQPGSGAGSAHGADQVFADLGSTRKVKSAASTRGNVDTTLRRAVALDLSFAGLDRDDRWM